MSFCRRSGSAIGPPFPNKQFLSDSDLKYGGNIIDRASSLGTIVILWKVSMTKFCPRYYVARAWCKPHFTILITLCNTFATLIISDTFCNNLATLCNNESSLYLYTEQLE